MKKILVISLSTAVLMSGCGAGNDNTAAGGFMGAQLGSILGSAIGGISVREVAISAPLLVWLAEQW